MKNYKEKYECALETIQEILSSGSDSITMSRLKLRLQSVFPELKESEDEKIRKALIRFHKSTIDVDGIKGADIIAWLEKQKEFGTFDVPKTPINDAVEVTSRMQYISDDMKPIAEFIMGYANWDLHKDEWNQPTLTVPLFRVLDALIQRGKPYGECSQSIEEQGEQKPADKKEPKKIDDEIEIPFGAKDSELQEVTYYIPKGFHAEIDDDKVVIKKGEKSAAWSEEDEKMFRGLPNSLARISSNTRTDSTSINYSFFAEIDWLKHLKDRVQPKQEWSEEDERMYRMCVDAVEYYHTSEDESVIREWLQSLKERNTWKPSDEQLELLKDVFKGYEGLQSLYNDLKKL